MEYKDRLERFKQFIDTVRGHKDVKSRVAVLANPDNLTTMSILSKEEAHFLSVSHFLTNSPHWGLMFEPMLEFAQSRLEPNISVGGKGRDQTIQFVAAISEAKALQKIEGKRLSNKEDT